MSVYTTNDDELCCPLCGETDTHLGDVEVDVALPLPTNDRGTGTPRSVRLIGYCEHCLSRFALAFTQDRGRTIVTTARLGDVEEAA